MLELHGPSYRYQGEILERPQVIWVRDHHFDPTRDQPFAVDDLVKSSTCHPDQHWVVFDHVNQRDYPTPKNTLCMPLFLSWQATLFDRKNISPVWNSRSSVFNFMVNKRRPNRELLLVFLKHFGLTTPDYTLCWKDSNWIERGLLSAMTNNVRLQQIIQKTETDITSRMYLTGSEVVCANELIYRNHLDNADVYQAFIKKDLFESSCISLITEPVLLEREALITEKTIMAIYGGTLPIWIGGWGQANVMRDYGFDVFDDIVDHSYQESQDPVERCFLALERNLDLLRDFDRANNFLSNNQHRLQHNLDLLKTNVFQQRVLEQYNSSPDWVKSELIKIFEKWPVVIVQGDDCYIYGNWRCKRQNLEKTLPFLDIDHRSLVVTV